MPQVQSAPARGAEAVTPNDSTVVAFDAFYVGGTGGDVSVITDRNQTVTFTGVPAGTIIPLKIVRVRSTSTTATGIVGLNY